MSANAVPSGVSVRKPTPVPIDTEPGLSSRASTELADATSASEATRPTSTASMFPSRFHRVSFRVLGLAFIFAVPFDPRFDDRAESARRLDLVSA